MNVLIEQVVGNAYDVGVMVGETGNKKHPNYLAGKEQVRADLIDQSIVEIRTVFKLVIVASEKLGYEKTSEIKRNFGNLCFDLCKN